MHQSVAGTPWIDRESAEPRPSRADFTRFALWAGAVGFGGGLSVLGILRSALTGRRWVTEREFDNTATVAQMLPGGAAANALSLLGLRFFGSRGAIVGHAAFILPGFLATLGLAWVYERLGGIPNAGPLLGGLSAAIVGIIASLTLQMVRTSIGRPWQMGVAAVALAMSLEGGASSGEVALLGIGTGLVVDLGLKRARLARSRRSSRLMATPVGLPDEGEPLPPRNHSTLRVVAWPIAGTAVLATFGGGALLALALLFLRTGLGAYGGGFAIVPHLKATLVGAGTLTERQFADAVAVGKLTPGPVLLMATFIGYAKEGLAGAMVATIAIFTAPLLLTIALGRWLSRYRSRRSVRAALRGLTPSVVGMMAAAAVTLAMSLDGTRELAIAVVVAMTLTRFRVNPVLMLTLGGGVRVLLAQVGL